MHGTYRRLRRIFSIVGIVLLTTVLLLLIHRDSSLGTLAIQGVLLRQDKDVRRQQPVGGAQFTVRSGKTTVTAETDSQGYFRILLNKVVLPGTKLTFQFTRDSYQPLTVQTTVGMRTQRNPLYVFFMKETPQSVTPEVPNANPVKVTNLRIRYVENGTSETNIGSVIRTFEAANQANVPCNGHAPCSPDGRWKASIGSTSLDAGTGNEFRQVRVSCIAGPCPFTKIASSGYEKGGQQISVRVLDWSATATFLIEAEVFHSSLNSRVHHLFPVFFGRTLNFTLPETEEGVSIEAELNGTMMVFPLGPDANMSWAACTVRDSASADHARVYHCELKPGYSF